MRAQRPIVGLAFGMCALFAAFGCSNNNAGSPVPIPSTTPEPAGGISSVSIYAFGRGGRVEGKNPRSALVAVGGTLYGTTYNGGNVNAGTVYAITPSGQQSTLYSFRGRPNGDGSNPIAALTNVGTTLYGTTFYGGSNATVVCVLDGCGTLYSLDVSGAHYRVLHSFKQLGNERDIAHPYAGVIVEGGLIFGTTDPSEFSLHGYGGIYEITTAGTEYKVIHHFAGLPHDGAGSKGDLLDNGAGTIFGTTERGGGANMGTVFRFTTTGSQYGIVYPFSLGRDAHRPAAGVFKYGEFYYGTTYWGGAHNAGAIYRFGPGGYHILYSFRGGRDDGAHPMSKLVAANGMLYGTTYWGGTDNLGTIFTIDPNGGKYEHFSFLEQGNRKDGAHPEGGLTLMGGKLYGTTVYGGPDNAGIVYRVDPLPGNPTPSPTPVPTPTATPSPTPTPTATPSPGTPSFASVYSFKGGDGDGAEPLAGLTEYDGRLYGTTYYGGKRNHGTVYRVQASGVTHMLYWFGNRFSADGSNPHGELTFVDGKFYGTTEFGGSDQGYCIPFGCGTIFNIDILGHHENTLVNFGPDGTGEAPTGPLLFAGGRLFGTTIIGGVSRKAHVSYCPPDCLPQCQDGCGILYSVDPSGANYAVLHAFDFSTDRSLWDGAFPKAGVVKVGNTLYGTTSGGGKPNNATDHYGTAYKYDIGGRESVLTNFNGKTKGAIPLGTLVEAGGAFYGTAMKGGKNCGTLGCGVIFKLDLSGRRPEEVVLYQFGGFPDGAYPEAGLYYYNGMLYGTTFVGGAKDIGTVFRISPSGTGYQIVHNFLGPEGSHPKAPLTIFNGALYGTTEYGGASNKGTVYKLTFP